MTKFKQASDKNGNTLEIVYEDNPTNYLEQDTFVKLFCWHKRYDLGHNHDYKYKHIQNLQKLKWFLIKNENALIIRKVFMYDHGGVSLSLSPFNSLFDSGFIGFIFATEEDIKDWYKVSKITPTVESDVSNFFKSFLKEYTLYLNGQVYGYIVTDKNDEHLDSCFGFYGLDFENNGIKSYLSDDLHPLLDKLEEV